MQSEPSLKTSAQAFLRWGGQHAQFLGIIGVIIGGLVLGGTKIQHWREEARNTRIELGAKFEVLEKDTEVRTSMLEKEIEVLPNTTDARISQARAEASKEAADRFLLFGYAEQYAKYQNQALGGKVP